MGRAGRDRVEDRLGLRGRISDRVPAPALAARHRPPVAASVDLPDPLPVARPRGLRHSWATTRGLRCQFTLERLRTIEPVLGGLAVLVSHNAPVLCCCGPATSKIDYPALAIRALQACV
jgi:hypothetical protein